MFDHADEQSSTSPPPRILLAEDEPALRDLLSGAQGEGSDVVAAADGRDDRASRPWSSDALLLDEDMPGLKGRQALARLRSATGNAGAGGDSSSGRLVMTATSACGWASACPPEALHAGVSLVSAMRATLGDLAFRATVRPLSPLAAYRDSRRAPGPPLSRAVPPQREWALPSTSAAAKSGSSSS